MFPVAEVWHRYFQALSLYSRMKQKPTRLYSSEQTLLRSKAILWIIEEYTAREPEPHSES